MDFDCCSTPVVICDAMTYNTFLNGKSKNKQYMISNDLLFWEKWPKLIWTAMKNHMGSVRLGFFFNLMVSLSLHVCKHLR